MRLMLKITLILFISFFVLQGLTYAQNDEKIPDSTDTAVSDGYKQIKKTQQKAKEAGENNKQEDSNDVDESKNEVVAPATEEKSELKNNLEGVDSSFRRPLYSPKGKRDPFKPFIREVPKKEKESVITKTTPPIKRYPLEEFRIVGIVWVNSVPKAMVIDPEKNTYFLGKDDEIGNKEGVIVEVRENGLLVSEKRFFEDVFGKEKVEITKSVLAFAEEE